MATGVTSDRLAFGPVNGADSSSWSGIPACEMVEEPSTTQHEGSVTSCPITSSRLCTVGMYLSARLAEVGIEHLFAVPGDYNMTLLDEVVKEKRISLISCCNELNAGYAADGYARARSVAAMCTTFNVGSLSALNAVAGAYAHDLPLICIVGNPSSAQIGSWRFIHHSVRSGYDLSQRHIYRETTVDSVAIEHAETAPMLIDRAISSAICHSKPVLIEVCSNLAKAVVPAPNRFPFLSTPASSTHVLEKAVQATTQLLKDVKNAVVIVGSQVRAATAEDAVLRLVQALGCTAASMADSRGVFPEDHSSYIGLYMGKMAIPSSCREQVEAADACIFVGAAFSDTLTTGFSMKVNWAKTIQVGINRVKLPSQEFGAIYMKDFLNALTESIIMTDSSKYGCHQNGVVKVMTELISDQRAADAFNHSNGTVSTLATVTSERSSRTEQENGCHQCHDLPARVLSTRRRTSREADQPDLAPADRPWNNSQKQLSLDAVRSAIQGILTKESTIIADIGESLFTALKLLLPGGARMEIQTQYCSIGWALAATLGYSLGSGHNRGHTITVTGDGAFQMTAQEVSTMMRYNVPAIIFVLNNGWYMIEECVHSNPLYNQIQQWDYSKLVAAFAGDVPSSAKSQGFRVTSVNELAAAVAEALASDGVSLIDCRFHKDDYSEELLFFCNAMVEFAQSVTK